MPALNPSEVRAMIREGRTTNKPMHARMKKNKRYMDGDSVSKKDRDIVEGREQKVVVINIIKPAANLLIGMLATPNIDYEAMPMVMDAKKAGRQATAGLRQTAELNDLDITKTKVGESAIVEGVGWFLSGPRVRDLNPEVDPTQVTFVPSTWIWYELAATDPGLRNAKYMGISQWWQSKTAARRWPKFKDEIKGLRGQTIPDGTTTRLSVLYDTDDPAAAALPYIWGKEEWDINDKASEINPRKDEVMIHELYYRDLEPAHFYQTDDGHWHKYDPETEIEKLFAQNVRGFKEDLAPVIRRAVMCGPFILEDESLGTDQYPLTPFFWDRDITGAAYSFVEQVSHPQEEVNVRRMRAWWEVAAERVQFDDEWLDRHTDEDVKDVLENVGRPDGAIKGTGVMIVPNNPSEHMAFIAMSKAEVTETGAVTETMRGEEVGKSPRSAESKRQSTVQAGMGFEIHRQMFGFAYKLLGQKLLRLMIELHDGPWSVTINDPMSGEDVLTMIDPDDIPYMLKLSIGPASPTMLEQRIETILNLLPKLPPDAQLQTEAMLGALEALNVPGADVLEQALRGYIERMKAQQAMPVPPPPPKESVTISIPADKMSPEVSMALVQKYALGGSEPTPPPIANTEAAPQGAHRPRQDRIGQEVAQASAG